jgi:hypothetical protein
MRSEIQTPPVKVLLANSGNPGKPPALPSLKSSFRQCLRIAPLATLSLLVYAALPSSIIHGEVVTLQGDWCPAYLNWGDLLLAIGIAWTFLTRRLVVTTGIILWAISSGVLILASFLTSDAPNGALIAGMVYWLRFTAVFVFSASVTLSAPPPLGESLLTSVFLVLAANSVLVLSLLREDLRLYASGLTPSSFGAIGAVVVLIAMFQKRYAVMIICIPFVLLTISITSNGLLFLFGLTTIFFRTRHSRRQRFKIIVVAVCLMGLSVFALRQFEYFDWAFALQLDPARAVDFHGRTEIWQYAIDRLSEDFRPLGHGYNTASAPLHNLYEAPTAAHGAVANVSNFHSLIFELLWGVGLGVVPVYLYLIWRVISSWRARCYTAFCIFGIFLIGQTEDFSLLRPKAVVVFALLLGLGEGLLHRGRSPRNDTEARETAGRIGQAVTSRA